MSFIPPNSRLQLSDTTGNINNKGVVGSNTKAPYLSTFPTSNTGTSQGTYLHLGVDGQSNLRTDFLNASGTSSGGFNFWTSNSTQAPQELAQISTDGVLVDTQFVVNKSVPSPARVFSPPVDSISPDNIHINFPAGTNLTQPPYNFNQTFNPVYMTQNTGFYTINSLCYAALGSPSQVIIFNNDNTANPIPPNTFPTGFPIGDATGIVVGEPIFALTPPSSTTQISTLSDTLTLTDGTNTSVLSTTNLDIQDVANDARITGSFVGSNPLLICSNINQTTTGILDMVSVGFNDGISTRALLESYTPSLTLYDGTNTAYLTTSQLTFNGVPVSGSPASASVLNFFVDGDAYTMPVVSIDGATQFTSASSVNFYSSGDSSYTLTLPSPISYSSVVSATYFNQTKKTFYPISVSIPNPTIIVLEANFANGLNNFYFSGILFPV